MKKIMKFAVALVMILSVAMAKSSIIYAADSTGQNTNADPEYIIRVNRAADCVTIYQVEEGHGQTPIKAMVCSTGAAGHATPLGEFKTSNYYDWRPVFGGCYAQYAVRFNGNILFHSVPYHNDTPDSLKWEEYNLLGKHASLGCVRLSVADAKWIYDNCKQGTQVIVYDNPENPGPLGKPESIWIDYHDLDTRGWDPTDPDVNNPWNLPR